MQDQDKTKEQLIDELNELRRSFAELEVVKKSLTENESKYRQIIEKSNEAIFVIQDGRIHFANEKSSEIVGYSIKDILFSDAIATFVHPDDRQMVFQHHARRLQGDEEFYQYDFRIVCKDGNVRWLDVNPSIIMWEGKPAVLCFTSDITERKLTEANLVESEQKFRSLFENSLDGTLFTAPDGRIFDANEAACRMFGRARQEICQIGREGLVDTTDPRLAIALEHRWREGRWKGRLRFRRGDGTIFPVEISTNIYRDARGDDRTVMVIRDITDWRQRLRRSGNQKKNIVSYSRNLHWALSTSTPMV